jgi:hypothetical protein
MLQLFTRGVKWAWFTTIPFLFLLSPPGWTQQRAWRTPVPNETDLARYIRIALTVWGADYDSAIINYKRALKIAKNPCDRQYIITSLKVTEEAKRTTKHFAKLDEIERKRRLPGYPGSSSRLTSGYSWARIEATRSLSCSDKWGIWKGLPHEKDEP